MSRNPFVTLDGGYPIVPTTRLPDQPGVPRTALPMPDPSAPAELALFVYGTPAPKGSKDYKGRRKNGSAILVESAAATLVPWAAEVSRLAREAGVRLAGPVSVGLWFCLRRPQRARIDAPADRKPDVDKLARAVLDALTEAGTIEDDARVVDLHAQKMLVGPGQTGCRITVRSWR